MKLNFSKLLKPVLIISAAITLIGIIFLLVFSGGTFATFTMQNLRISLFVKVLFTAIFVVATTLIYFTVRFKKKGLFLALYTALSAAISAVISFTVSIVCRAPLGEYTFALMLFAVALSYVTAVVFANSFTSRKASRKKEQVFAEDSYSIAANLTWKTLVYLIAVICIVLVAAFVASLIFAVKVVPMYALPAVVVTIFSVIQTIAVGCRLYASKV